MTKYRVVISHNPQATDNPTNWSLAETDTLPHAKLCALQGLQNYPASIASILDQRHALYVGAYTLRGKTQLRPLWENKTQ